MQILEHAKVVTAAMALGMPLKKIISLIITSLACMSLKIIKRPILLIQIFQMKIVTITNQIGLNHLFVHNVVNLTLLLCH